jgi:hypothetical protein
MTIVRAFRSPSCSQAWRELEPSAHAAIANCLGKLPRIKQNSYLISVPSSQAEGHSLHVLVEYRCVRSLVRRRLEVLCLTLQPAIPIG